MLFTAVFFWCKQLALNQRYASQRPSFEFEQFYEVPMSEVIFRLNFYPQNLSAKFIRKIYPQFLSAKFIRKIYPQNLSAIFIRKIYPQNLSAKFIRKIYPQYLSAIFIRKIYPQFAIRTRIFYQTCWISCWMSCWIMVECCAYFTVVWNHHNMHKCTY